MTENRTALVIGASGGIGGELARRLQMRGWQVKALSRTPNRAMLVDPSLDWVEGDALDAPSLVRSAEGASVIVHAANPPGYKNWDGTVMPMLDGTIAAARAHGARVLLPGTLYNYGLDAGETVDETAPQNPISRKGAIRVAMERRLRDATGNGVTAIVVRAGDFFGPRCGNSWLAQGMLSGRGSAQWVLDPARRGVGHSWAYLPDLAEIMALLLERPHDLAAFDTFHVRGHWFDDNRTFAKAIRVAAGRPNAPILPFPWPLLRPVGVFNETFREMGELAYLWQEPLRLVDTKLRSLLGDLPETPIEEALTATLRELKRSDGARRLSRKSV